MGVPGALQVANLSKLDEKDVISYLKAQGKMRIGIDMYVLLHWAFGRHKEYHEDLVENPDYECDSVYEDVKKFLIDFVKEGFKLWLVYDGRTAPFKLAEQDRAEKREKARQEKKWAEAYNIEPIQAHYMWEVIQEYLCELEDKKPEPEQGMEEVESDLPIYQMVAPFEADAQLAQLALQDDVDIILTCDSDLIFHGVIDILFKTKDGLKLYENMLYEENGDTLDLMCDERRLVVAGLVGNDYTKGVRGYGIKKSMKLAKEVQVAHIKTETGRDLVDWHRYFLNVYEALDQKIIDKYTLASFNRASYKQYVLNQLGIVLSIYYFYPYYNIHENKIMTPSYTYMDMTGVKLLDFQKYIDEVTPEQWEEIVSGRMNPNTLTKY